MPVVSAPAVTATGVPWVGRQSTATHAVLWYSSSISHPLEGDGTWMTMPGLAALEVLK